MMAELPVCFVSMPFGRRQDDHGGMIDFDLIYQQLIQPGIESAGVAALRADRELVGGVVGKSHFDRILAAPVAVFDLTTHDPNVLYELGMRQAARPQAALLLALNTALVPLDVAQFRLLRYELNAAGRAANPAQFIRLFADQIRTLLRESPPVDVARSLTVPSDALRMEVRDDEQLKRRIAEAKRLGADELYDIEEEIGDISQVSPEIALAFFEAYRARGAWRRQIDLAKKLPPSVLAAPRLQEQLALALNRAGEWERAEQIVQELLHRNGPSAETCGVLGRVYKDQYEQAQKGGDAPRAETFLAKAINAYMQGFEADWRDAYPGINAVTLMELQGRTDPRFEEILPVVLYAAKRKLATGRGDYWDEATRLELLVLADKQEEATGQLERAVKQLQFGWQGESTARNLRLIRESRERRGVPAAWIESIEQKLAAPP
jgi:tetratricopeptide (TPR) repeat protein